MAEDKGIEVKDLTFAPDGGVYATSKRIYYGNPPSPSAVAQDAAPGTGAAEDLLLPPVNKVAVQGFNIDLADGATIDVPEVPYYPKIIPFHYIANRSLGFNGAPVIFTRIFYSSIRNPIKYNPFYLQYSIDRMDGVSM